MLAHLWLFNVSVSMQALGSAIGTERRRNVILGQLHLGSVILIT